MAAAAASSSQRDGDSMLRAHRGQGPGHSRGLIERAFEPFFRVDPARRQSVPGAGLGLAIAKEIIERSGGTITIENKLPRGLKQTVGFEISG